MLFGAPNLPIILKKQVALSIFLTPKLAQMWIFREISILDYAEMRLRFVGSAESYNHVAYL